jgi:hypothetical protein
VAYTSTMTTRAPLTTVCHAAIRDHANGDISQRLEALKAEIVASRLSAEVLAEHNRQVAANGFKADSHAAIGSRTDYLAKISKSPEAFAKYRAAYEANPKGKELKTIADAIKEHTASVVERDASKATKAAHVELLNKLEAAKRAVWSNYKKTTSVVIQAARSGSGPSDPEHAKMIAFDELRRDKDRVPKASASILASYVSSAVAEVVEALRREVASTSQSKIDIKHLLTPSVQNTQLVRIAKQFPAFGKVAAWFESQQAKDVPKAPFPIEVGDFLSVFKKLIPKKGKNSEEGSKVSQNLRLALSAMTEEVVAYICRDIVPAIMKFSGKKTIDAKTMKLALTTATALMGGLPEALVSEWDSSSSSSSQDSKAAEEAAAAAAKAAEEAAAAAAKKKPATRGKGVKKA